MTSQAATQIASYLSRCSAHRGADDVDPAPRSRGCVASRVLDVVGDDEGAGWGCGTSGPHSSHPKGAQAAGEIPINVVSGSGPRVCVLDTCMHRGSQVLSEGCVTHHLMA